VALRSTNRLPGSPHDEPATLNAVDRSVSFRAYAHLSKIRMQTLHVSIIAARILPAGELQSRCSRVALSARSPRYGQSFAKRWTGAEATTVNQCNSTQKPKRPLVNQYDSTRLFLGPQHSCGCTALYTTFTWADAPAPAPGMHLYMCGTRSNMEVSTGAI
jgi:hypothetical protein